MCPYCRGTGVERDRDQARPVRHRARGHELPINGSTGCGCTYDPCSQTHVKMEVSLLMADGTKAAIVSYLNPDLVTEAGWLIETRETIEEEDTQ